MTEASWRTTTANSLFGLPWTISLLSPIHACQGRYYNEVALAAPSQRVQLLGLQLAGHTTGHLLGSASGECSNTMSRSLVSNALLSTAPKDRQKMADLIFGCLVRNDILTLDGSRPVLCEPTGAIPSFSFSGC